MTDALLWLDLETTGTDETKDSIIEVGVVPTSLDLAPLGEWVSCVKPTDEALGRMMRTPPVLTMHVDNGLFDAIRESTPPTIGAVDHQLDLWLADITAVQGVTGWVLAGSGVGHFDRRFIKAQMPKLDRRLRHWCIDVGVLRRAYAMWGQREVQPIVSHLQGTKTHRALDDVYVHLAEARQWQDFFVASTTDQLGARFL